MESSVPTAVALIDVGAGIEHCGHDRRVAVQRGPGERCAAPDGVLAIDRPGRGEPLAHGGLVARENLLDGWLRVDRAMGKPPDRHVERPNRRGRDHKWQEDPHGPLLEQAPEPAAAVDEHREIAAEQKEERHPEAVHRHQEERQQIAALRVVDGPGKREETERGMERDPQQHGEAAQGVEIGASLCHEAGCWSAWGVSEHDRNLPVVRCPRLQFRFRSR